MRKRPPIKTIWPIDCPYSYDSFDDCSLRGDILRCKRSNVHAAGYAFEGCAHSDGTCTAIFTNVMDAQDSITVTVRPSPYEARVYALHGMEDRHAEP